MKEIKIYEPSEVSLHESIYKTLGDKEHKLKWIKDTDHKAVVETMQIEDLRKQECIYLLHKQVEELEKDKIKLRCCENCSNNPHECFKHEYDRTCYSEDKKHWAAKGIE